MAKIFVSYRRSDTEAITGRIFDRMKSHYGDGNVIIDIDSFPFGHDFRSAITTEIEACDAVIAVIGQHWAGDGERRRIDEENDFVRIEIEAALARNIPLVPLLVDGAAMPAPSELPSGLQPLAFRNGAEVDLGRDFHVHIDRIIRSLDRSLGIADPSTQSVGLSSASPPLRSDAAKEAASPVVALDAQTPTPHRPSPCAPIIDSARSGTADSIGRATSLAERFERISERHETVNVTVFALCGGFLLCMASAFADVHIVSRADHGIVKQVGFLYAPNWVITYLILFPLYLMMFSILIRRRKRLVRLLAEFRTIVRADGSPVVEGELSAYWSRFIARVSLVLWVFVLVVALQSTQEWVKSSVMPLLAHDTGDRAVDWSLIAARSGNEVWIWKVIFFTGFAYAYMGFALFIYLAVMLYGVAISAFVNHLSETPEELRMTRFLPPLVRELSGVAGSVYACTFLGLCAAFRDAAASRLPAVALSERRRVLLLARPRAPLRLARLDGPRAGYEPARDQHQLAVDEPAGRRLCPGHVLAEHVPPQSGPQKRERAKRSAE